jgi:hypothetical protein
VLIEDYKSFNENNYIVIFESEVMKNILLTNHHYLKYEKRKQIIIRVTFQNKNKLLFVFSFHTSSSDDYKLKSFIENILSYKLSLLEV